ncbi:MAG: arsenosugar biosynthesis radical SAM protein ArsS [Bryobacteraceae bacterium]|nr:arsenosugar biosynthesis radical SAM protein ArsS [Bryobacteraceae bacterium]MDW8378774.1 arsenosugar biosynthesis radical SAM protein ArsS [Bryobacterales bacterium]
MSLHSERHPLAEAAQQLHILQSCCQSQPRFEESLARFGLHPLRATAIETLQVNLGKFCNQTCKHCHVDAGPDRRESMSRETAELCIRALRFSSIPILDITGGAPELNPHFRWLVEQAKLLGRHVIDRCNLTVLLLPSQSDLAEFLAAHEVEIIASLPYFQASHTDAQRGPGIFAKSVEALRRLNRLGYGMPGSSRKLNLVYNPAGAYLPPAQHAIEADFRRELRKRYGIEFHSLYTITNMPVSRFLEFLLRSGNYDRYIQRLIDSFNPVAARGVMCRKTLSVGWDGTLYDCDFNQMLELPVRQGLPRHIRDFDPMQLGAREIVVGQHCYGCTAGSGSSCSGAITK